MNAFSFQQEIVFTTFNQPPPISLLPNEAIDRYKQSHKRNIQIVYANKIDGEK